jgi:DNA-binding PadR family transcriptional regulator
MTVRAALLQLLAEGERHGYQLKVDFEARTGGIWPLNVGQVYTTLDRLVRDEKVLATADSEGDGEQTVYRITEDGRQEVKQWLASSPTDSGPARDELIMKVLVAFGGAVEEALEVVDDQRSALLATLQLGRRQQRARTGEDAAAERLAHDAVLSRIEADLTWLDRCEEQLLSQRPDRKQGKR